MRFAFFGGKRRPLQTKKATNCERPAIPSLSKRSAHLRIGDSFLAGAADRVGLAVVVLADDDRKDGLRVPGLSLSVLSAFSVDRRPVGLWRNPVVEPVLQLRYARGR